MAVDTAVTVPVNVLPLIDDTDFKTRETSVAYNAAGVDLTWNLVTTAGVMSSTAVTPTTSGVYDWTDAGAAADAMVNGSVKLEVDVATIGGQTAAASGTVTFPNATLASTTNIAAGTITSIANAVVLPTTFDSPADIWNYDIPSNFATTGTTAGAVVDKLTEETVTLSSDVALGSASGQMIDDGTAWSFDRMTDSQEAIRNNHPMNFSLLSVNGSGRVDVGAVAGDTGVAAFDPATDEVTANVVKVDGFALDTHDAGEFPSDVRMLLGTAPTEGATGRIAAAFTKFFDKASPTGTINSLPDAVPGSPPAFGGGPSGLATWGNVSVGFGYPLASANITSHTSQVVFTCSSIPSAQYDDQFKGMAIILDDGELGISCTRYITHYVHATNTFTIDSPPNFTIDDSFDTVRIFHVPKQILDINSWLKDGGLTDAKLEAIKTKTDYLQNATAGTAGGVFIAGSNAATTVNITGNLSGSVDSVTDNVGGTINGLTATALADLFDTNSGKSYSDAVAGSVVTEVADHATTPSLTAAGIADAVLDELLAGHATAGSLSKAVSDVYNFLNGAPTFGDAMDDQGYTTALASKLDTNVDAKIREIPNKLPSLLVTTAIDDATPSQTSFVLADGPANDDALNGELVIVTNDSNPTSIKKAVGLVKDYDQATKTVTLFADPGGFTFADGNKVDVIASGVHQPLW